MGEVAQGGASALRTLPVLLLDGQTSGASPARGALIELAWARLEEGAAGSSGLSLEGGLVALEEGDSLPRRIRRMTGISASDLEGAPGARRRWSELVEAASELGRPAPTVVHYARFERAFLEAWHEAYGEGEAFPLRWICTHAIARRLFPELPRRGLRALAGFLGHPVGEMKRAGSHVEATATIWRGVLEVLEAEEGVRTLEGLEAWLEVPAKRHARHVYPMPRATRLAVPERPGVYRMLGATAEVLYVGKARSLKRRVNSYFQKQKQHSERTLELLTRARDLAITEVETPLEAALLESDEIKRIEPPYNVALRGRGREVVFASRDLSRVSGEGGVEHPIGPVLGAHRVERMRALLAGLRGEAEVTPEVLGVEAAWAPEAEVFDAGWARFLEAHRGGLGEGVGLLGVQRLGTALWRARRLEMEAAQEAEAGLEDEDDDDEDDEVRESWSWSPEAVAGELERRLMRWSSRRRRARWLVRLSESRLVWTPEPGAVERRVLVIGAGRVVQRRTLASAEAEGMPALPRVERRWARRLRSCRDVATWDRLRVLTTELRRLVRAGCEVELWLGPRRPLSGVALERALWWV